MQKLLAFCPILFSLALFAGCEGTMPGLGESAGNASLPSGLRLLESDESECDGTLQVSEGGISDSDAFEAEMFVEPGQNATFEFEDGNDNVRWACVGGDASPEVETMNCPDDTSHVRITRASSGGELLFECYG